MAWPHTMTSRAVIAVTITQKNIASWLFEEHESKVFGTHGGINACVHALFSN